MGTAKKRKSSKQIAAEAAEIAANELALEIDGEEETQEFEEDGAELTFAAAEAATDVFEEGFKKAMSMKDAPRFHIKKNSQFLTVKDFPYSWEKLQSEYGPGYYQVICKARSNGRILKSQTEMVGDPNEGKVESVDEGTAQTTHDNNLAVLGWLQQSQERAEQRAQALTKNNESSLAMVMQTVMTAQQESSKTMMQMMMEQSKQTQTLLLTIMQSNQQPKGPDPMITLLTTLLTKEKPKDGMQWGEVMKLMKDAERDAETRTKNMYEMIEKKSDALAEIKAEAMSGGEEGEESLSKTLLKGFVPVLSQIVAGQNAQGQQMALQQQFEAQRAGNPALNEGFVGEGPMRPAIGAARPAQRPAQRPAPQQMRQTEQAMSSRREDLVPTSSGRNLFGSETPKPVSGSTEVQNQAPITQGPMRAGRVERAEGATGPQASGLDARHKDMIFNFVASDIAGAMLQGVPASQASEVILKKLEIEGVPRQTVAQGFTVEDFHAYAEQFIPQESLGAAKVWLKEFHESIQKPEVVVTAAPPTPTPIRTVNAPDGQYGAGATANGAKPVPAKRSPAPNKPGAQSRPLAKNI